MVDLILKPERTIKTLPVKIGSLSLNDVTPELITAVMLRKKGLKNCQKDLGTWVEPGEVKDSRYGKLVWSGYKQAFLFGECNHIEGADCVDLSGGWVFFELEGSNRYEVMERLTPLNLRDSDHQAPRAYRSKLGHMMALIIVEEAIIQIGVMSSFAVSAEYEIREAMKSVSAIHSEI